MVDTCVERPACKVEKEQLDEIEFVEKEVLASVEERRRRVFLLEQAMILGNGFKKKVRIYFMSKSGPCVLETTVWGVTERNVLFKGGRTVPIHAIYRVEL